MEKRNIGSLEVTLVGLGCNNFGWRIDAGATAKVVDAALESGINFFDTADVYGTGQSEEYLGRALGKRRHDVVIASKFGMKMGDGLEGASAVYIPRAVDDSLRRLGTDRIDLYQLHRPDPSVPIADTLGALNDLVQAGKVREIGCSNFSAPQLRDAESVVKDDGARFVSVQNEYSLFHREPEAEVLPECEQLGIAFLPYFPLASGLLSGKYRKGQPLPEGSRGHAGWGPKMFTEANLEIVEKLVQYAESHGHALLELAFSWLASKQVVASVIAGATSAEQVKTNAKAANWKLSEGELAEIDTLVRAA